MERILSVGSVVELIHIPKHQFVILGYFQKVQGEIYDYIGTLYPNGMIGEDSCVVFRKEEISKVLFEGYLDEEGEAFTQGVPQLIELLYSPLPDTLDCSIMPSDKISKQSGDMPSD